MGIGKKLIFAASFSLIFASAGAYAYAADHTVGSAEELTGLAARVNAGESFEGDTVTLTADIVLNKDVVDYDGTLRDGSYSSWTPIGTEDAPFKGSFNGGGHVITGIYINDPELSYQGLFGVVSGGDIYNITVKDSYISVKDHAGAVAGYAIDGAVISSCHNDCTAVRTENRSGGIVGWTDRSDVYNCSSNGYCSSSRCSGGIVGDVYSNGKIYNCYNAGAVEGSQLVGGISGGTTSADIQNCINVGEVSDGYLIAGGAGSRSIENCFALSNDTVNTGLTIGTSSSTAKTFSGYGAALDEPVEMNGVSYTRAVDALNAWVTADETEIMYSPWVQRDMYPYLRDGVVSAVRTSFGSETSMWSNSDLEEAYKAQLIPDVIAGEDLTQRISRAEFAAVAVRLYEVLTGAEASSAGADGFTDIAGTECEQYILKANALDIVLGVGSGKYAPEADITREELATMLCRTIKKYSFEDWSMDNDSEYYLDTSGVKVFEDDALISEWAKPSVYYMSKLGIITGVDELHFAPRNTTSEQEAEGYASATREQALAMSLRIYRISDILK